MTENSLQSGGVAGADAAWIDGINLYDEFDQIRRQTAHVGTVDEQYKIAIAHPLSRIYRIANAVANDATLLEAVAAAAKIKITKRAEKNLHYTLIKALFPEERSSGTFTDYANALKRAASWGFTYEDARGYLQAHGPYSLRDGRHRPDSVPADSGSTERKAKKAGPGSKANDDAPAVPSNQDGEATAAAPSDGVVSPAVNTAPATAAAVKALPLAVCGTDSISGPVVNPPQRHQGASKQGLGFGQLYGSKYQGRKAGATLEVLLDENGHFVISEVISYYTFEAVKPIPDLKPAASQSQDDHHQAPCFDTDESPDDTVRQQTKTSGRTAMTTVAAQLKRSMSLSRQTGRNRGAPQYSNRSPLLMMIWKPTWSQTGHPMQRLAVRPWLPVFLTIALRILERPPRNMTPWCSQRLWTSSKQK